MAGLIVHDWLAKTGGSERVVEAMIEAFPDAHLQVLWDDAPDVDRGTTIHDTWLARTPLRLHKGACLPITPTVWRHVRAPYSPEWLLVSSHAFAHHVRLPSLPDIPKLAYVHTPARYVWMPEIDCRGDSPLARLASRPLRTLDQRRAGELDAVAANSHYVAARIARFWERESEVIYPPVDVADIISTTPTAQNRLSDGERRVIDELGREPFVLGASRLIPYKEVGQALRVGRLLGLPVVIAGSGPEEARLRAEAESLGVHARFVIDPSTALLRALFAQAVLYVFMAIEDFGIMPVESMASGTPVLACAEGGASESVLACEGGAVVNERCDDLELISAAHAALSVDVSEVAQNAMMFDRSRFVREITAWVPQSVGTKIP
ncbi:glycosyltransferase [Demequina aurantiaca]|uniref:glycosyltransferase n=1 Tax=Demequina aurantiaca TaxID=676200 RepID=UPI003D331145